MLMKHSGIQVELEKFKQQYTLFYFVCYVIKMLVLLCLFHILRSSLFIVHIISLLPIFQYVYYGEESIVTSVVETSPSVSLFSGDRASDVPEFVDLTTFPSGIV